MRYLALVCLCVSLFGCRKVKGPELDLDVLVKGKVIESFSCDGTLCKLSTTDGTVIEIKSYRYSITTRERSGYRGY